MQREKITLGWAGKSAPVADVTFVEVDQSVSGTDPALKSTLLCTTSFSEPDALKLCLSLWKIWMDGDSDRDLGFKTVRGLCGGGGGTGGDIYEAQQENDMRIAQATDAMINSMSRMHVWAIYRSCSVATAWNFPNISFLGASQEAHAELEKKLRKNICTGTLF